VALPILGGVFVAVAVAALWSLNPLWVGFVLFGVAACVPAFMVRRGSGYWLAVFLLVLPFNLHKFFGTKEHVAKLLETVGGTAGTTTPLLEVSDLAFLMMLVVWFVRRLDARARLFLPRISVLPLAYLLWVLLGALFAPLPSLSAFEVLRQAKFFVIYLFTSCVVRPRREGKLILGVLLLGLALQSVVTLVRYESQQVSALFGGTFGEIGESFDVTEDARLESVTRDEAGEASATRRGTGTFPHPNSTAMHLALTLPMALALIMIGKWRTEKWLYLALAGAGAAALYTTFSRSSMAGFMVSLVVCLSVAFWRGIISRQVFLAACCVAAILAPAMVFEAHSYLTSRSDYSEAHLSHLKAGIQMIRISPLLGVGLNNSTPLREQFTPGGESLVEKSVPLHSHYLLQAVETGLVGFVLYYLFFALVCREAIRQCRLGDVYGTAFGLGVLGAYTAIAVATITDYPGADALQTFLWFYAGLIVGLRREERDAASSDLAPGPAHRPASAAGRGR